MSTYNDGKIRAAIQYQGRSIGYRVIVQYPAFGGIVTCKDPGATVYPQGKGLPTYLQAFDWMTEKINNIKSMLAD